MATKKLKNQKALKKRSPEELVDIWDEDTSEIWYSLRQDQQKFYIAYVSNGFNATQAYRSVINELSSDDVAKSAGPRMLAAVGLSKLLTKMSTNNAYDLMRAKQVYSEGMEAIKPIFGRDADGQPEKIEDVPDHLVRKACADSMCKVIGAYVEKSEITVNKTLIINQAQIEDLNKVLQATGQPEITAAKPIKQQTFTQTTIETVEPSDPFTVCGGDDIQVID